MEYSYSYTGDLSPAGLLAIFSAFVIPALIIALVLYVYTSWTLMVIAQKTNTPNAWLAWIPIGNLYLMTQIAQVPWWTFLLIFLSWIPIIGSLGLMALVIWWWWKIAERRNRPGWWGLLIGLVPLVNLVMMGMLAWTEADQSAPAKPVESAPEK